MTEKRQQWTPGPWKAERREVLEAFAGRQCEFWIEPIYASIRLTEFAQREQIAQAAANARLIAQAPALYQALRESVKAMQADCCSINCPCCGDLRSAIAQAEAALLAAEGGK